MKSSSNLIQEALAKGQSALSEYDSKRFLSCFGIPVCQEAIVSDADSAASEADRVQGAHDLSPSGLPGQVLCAPSRGEQAAERHGV